MIQKCEQYHSEMRTVSFRNANNMIQKCEQYHSETRTVSFRNVNSIIQNVNCINTASMKVLSARSIQSVSVAV